MAVKTQRLKIIKLVGDCVIAKLPERSDMMNVYILVVVLLVRRSCHSTRYALAAIALDSFLSN